MKHFARITIIIIIIIFMDYFKHNLNLIDIPK